MTDQWKPGDGPGPWPAMVMVTRIDEHRAWAGAGALSWLPAKCLRPIPPAITPEQQAVLGAATEQERLARIGGQNTFFKYIDAVDATNESVRAMLAAIAALEAKS